MANTLIQRLDLASSPTKLLAVVALWLGICGIALTLLHKRQTKVSNTPEKPQVFQTPLPLPLEDFNLSTQAPRLYRPFRHGPNHVTMGIRRLDWNHWIEMDSNFTRYHDHKVTELNKSIEAHVKYVDNAVTRDACFEMLEELTQYLTHRYPRIFSLRDGVLRNAVTGEAFQYPAENPTEALVTAAKLVQDDLVLMVERDDGEYHLDAGAVTLPGFWRLGEKFGMSLDTLHFEANVPHYAAKLQKSMNRFFNKMSPGQPVTRNNLDDGLHWSHRMAEKESDQIASWATANSRCLKLEEIHFRSERQTLRRLPRSGALMFTIRTYFEPITTIAQEPYVPGRLAEAIRQWDESVSTYKGRAHWEDILLPYLDEMDRGQKERGELNGSEGEFPY